METEIFTSRRITTYLHRDPALAEHSHPSCRSSPKSRLQMRPSLRFDSHSRTTRVNPEPKLWFLVAFENCSRTSSKITKMTSTDENAHLTAYQEVYPSSSRGSFGGGKGRGRYYITDGPRQLCWACLGEHESTTCIQKRCYRCAQPGHESAMCRSQEFCGFCNGSGHSKPFQCFRQVYNMGLDPRLHEEVQCIVCGLMGHINCHNQKAREARAPKRTRDESRGYRHH